MCLYITISCSDIWTTISLMQQKKAMSWSIPELIRKKRDGLELTPEEIHFFIESVVTNNIDDSQTGAMLMAMYLNKLTTMETISLTKSMITTGETLSFEKFSKNVLVDKHSTGGVGDKISIILAPALAACGLKVPMISGRSLGYTGGTLDKLESIPGFQVNLNSNQMNECLTKSGCFIGGATSSLAPADGILYKIRDIVSTVEDPSLIVASILSKKAAEGIGTLVMDVKFGKGSAFKNEEESKEMGKLLKEVGNHLNLNIHVILSDMNVPLGNYIGNALEVIESIKCLRNEIDNSVTELVKFLGAIVLESKGISKTIEEGKEMIQENLKNFKALNCFQSMLTSQGVSNNKAKDLCSGQYWKVLPKAPYITPLLSPKNGIIAAIDAHNIAKACWRLGAGRTKTDKKIDHSVGMILLKTVGNDIDKGEPWVQVHHLNEKLDPEVESLIIQSLSVEPYGYYVDTKLKTYLI